MSNITKDKKFLLYGCVISKNDLSELLTIFLKYVPDLKTYVNFDKEGESIMLPDSKFNEYNFDNKIISSILIIGDTYFDNKDGRFSVKFENSSVFLNNSYEITISSDNLEKFAVLTSSITDWIKRVSIYNKQLIRFINSDLFTFVLPLIVVVPMFAGSIIMFREYYLAVLIVLAFFALGVLLTVSIHIVTRKCFPITEINIGKNRHSEWRKKFLWLLTTIVFPLIFLLISIFLK